VPTIPASRREVAARFVRYCVVGVIGTIVHFATTIALVEIGRLDPVVASVIGFVAALLVSFVLNRQWTFASQAAVSTSLARYVAVSVFGFLLNIAIMAAVTKWLNLSYLIGLALVVLIIPAVNFTLNARWTFRHGT